MGRITRSAYLPFLSVLLVLGGAACGSSSKSGSLLSPSALETTATISGTVEGGATSSGVSAQSHHSSAGLRVSVLGTGVSTTTDGSGQFTLSGVPAGQIVTLRFEGSGIDARVEIGGLTPGQVLHVSIQVSGSSAHVVGVNEPTPSPTPSPTPDPSATPSPSPSPDDDGENEAEFKGTIESISAPNLTVAGRLVVTDASTGIKSHGDTIPFSTLAVGNVVEVEGQTLADGSILAKKISLEDGDDNDGDNGDNEGDNGDDNGGDDDSGEDVSANH